MGLEGFGEVLLECGDGVSLYACAGDFYRDVVVGKDLLYAVLGEVEVAFDLFLAHPVFGLAVAEHDVELLHKGGESICKLCGGDEGGLCVRLCDGLEDFLAERGFHGCVCCGVRLGEQFNDVLRSVYA